MSETLKPCPFCGEALNLRGRYESDAGGYVFECGLCFAQGSVRSTLPMAIDAWNTRPLESAAHERGRKEVTEKVLKLLHEWPGDTFECVEGWEVSDAIQSLLSERKGGEK